MVLVGFYFVPNTRWAPRRLRQTAEEDNSRERIAHDEERAPLTPRVIIYRKEREVVIFSRPPSEYTIYN